MNYNKESATSELIRRIGWKKYGNKHGESNFTKLFQNYILPRRFGYDKRKPHLSSLILSGQLTRSEALHRLSEPLYEKLELSNDIDYFCRKLRISLQDFDSAMKSPLTSHKYFKNWDHYFRIVKLAQRNLQKLTGKTFDKYS